MELKSDLLLESDQHLRPFRDETFRVSADGTRVIGATDAYIGVWDTLSGKLLKRLDLPDASTENDCIGKLDCSADLSVVVGTLTTKFTRLTLAYDARLVVWDGDSGDAIRTFVDKNAREIIDLDLSEDGTLLATTNGKGAKVWNLVTGEVMREVLNENLVHLEGNERASKPFLDHVWSVKLSTDNCLLAVGDTLGVKLWSMESGDQVRQLDGPYQYSSGGTELHFSSDGSMIARTGAWMKDQAYSVPIWSTQSGKKLFELQTESTTGLFGNNDTQFLTGGAEAGYGLAIFQLQGESMKASPPQKEPLRDNVRVGTQYRGESAEKLISEFKPIWSKPQSDVQVGIALTDSSNEYQVGQKIHGVVFYRNVGSRAIQIDHKQDVLWKGPTITDSKGSEIELDRIPLLGTTLHFRDTLQPGEAYGPFYFNVGLGENPQPNAAIWTPFWNSPSSGKYHLSRSISVEIQSEKAAGAKATILRTLGVEFNVRQ